jgi:hypothetical protein
MSVVCPRNTRFVDDQCYYDCPYATVISSQDQSMCVADVACPATITTQDAVYNNVCNKVEVAAFEGTCPEGYSLWTSTICYADCPVYLSEYGNACLKRTVTRQSVEPSCSNSWFYTYNNGSCEVSILGAFTIVFLFVLLFYIVYVFTRQDCTSRR